MKRVCDAAQTCGVGKFLTSWRDPGKWVESCSGEDPPFQTFPLGDSSRRHVFDIFSTYQIFPTPLD